MISFAMIGAGRIGAVHARSIAAHPDARLVVVADPMEDAAQRIAAGHGARVVADAGAVFDDPSVDAVVVGSPTRFHVDHVLAAVEAGKAVFVEKPIDLDLARADRCIAAVGDRASRVMVGFNRRFDPATADLRGRVLAGEIGPLEQLTIVSRDPAPAPAAYLAGSGGIFKDMTIHDLDTARSMLGEVAEVSAVGQHLDRSVEDEWDAAVVTLHGVSGAVATIINSRHSATGYDQRIEAFGRDGSLRQENVVETAVQAFTAASAGATRPYLHDFLERYAAAYAAELDAFITAIEAGVAPSPTLLDGREALALAEAATEAARTGRRVRVQSR
ncbi:Gfo/Idh/MocA family oxidoreductase [Amnibacterium sp. CER49]|uniref:Gfo/Idh/MocA family oxidoreductase n=1 Tax=Amnibacterium sp. CER49 TaxID=3039161 RepID=UPI00244853A7|nr:Gfo/Idh/MocA family oxidoreductase [Amnibacterium sp. CER49]MDH2444889.1 Gfo/Idh/MocA family oxidoreductase [Amnibacterium sp. CER49]